MFQHMQVVIHYAIKQLLQNNFKDAIISHTMSLSAAFTFIWNIDLWEPLTNNEHILLNFNSKDTNSLTSVYADDQ